MQDIFVLILFLAAITYLVRYFYRRSTSVGCSTGCSGCGKIDVDKIIAQHQQAEHQKQQSHGNKQSIQSIGD